MKRVIAAAAIAVCAGAAPAVAEGFRVNCADLETLRSPTKGAPARLIVRNERTTEVELKVIRNNGSEISLGAVKGNSEREITTRLRYLFAIYEGGNRCLSGLRITEPKVSIIIK